MPKYRRQREAQHACGRASLGRRRAMTLAELLAVSCILLMMAGTMGALAVSVQDSGDEQYSQRVSLQHGQVIVQRIQAAISAATAGDKFPGFLVIADSINGRSYPDTLVVWKPSGVVADSDALPKMNELVIYSPSHSSPNELWEITAPSDSRTAPATTNLSQWRAEIATLKTSSQARRVTVTNLLRTANAAGTQRAAIRFISLHRPSEIDWSQYLAGSKTWESLPFVQGIRGSVSGLRQSWCRFELQLCPYGTNDHSRDLAIPFFGSGAVLYELHKT